MIDNIGEIWIFVVNKEGKRLKNRQIEEKPVLVVMAAGMGSRFGGLKQIEPVDEQGHIIIDFSLYDAWKAGFRRIVFVIKREFEKEFRESIGDRMEKWFQIDYVFQELNILPKGFEVPPDRKKPWGTGHAVACCRGVVNAPFAVINADDFYGAKAFSVIYEYLSKLNDESQYAMIGYPLRNTLTEYGSVARGVCEVKDGLLCDITERTSIYKYGDNARYTEDGEHFTELSGDSIVSMNLWGFSTRIMDELWKSFPQFLEENIPVNPGKCEFFLPSVVKQQVCEKTATVHVLPCEETWYGVTYHEDLERVVNAIRQMKKCGIYHEKLWESHLERERSEERP